MNQRNETKDIRKLVDEISDNSQARKESNEIIHEGEKFKHSYDIAKKINKYSHCIGNSLAKTFNQNNRYHLTY